MDTLINMFCGADGKISSMRVASVFVVLSVMGVFVYLNIMSGVQGKGLVNLSWELVTLITSVLGVKAYQHSNENKGEDVVGGETPETIQATEQSPVVNGK